MANGAELQQEECFGHIAESPPSSAPLFIYFAPRQGSKDTESFGSGSSPSNCICQYVESV